MHTLATYDSYFGDGKENALYWWMSLLEPLLFLPSTFPPSYLKKKIIYFLPHFYAIDVTAEVELMNKERGTMQIFHNKRGSIVYLLRFK